jgi:hypothetical protein
LRLFAELLQFLQPCLFSSDIGDSFLMWWLFVSVDFTCDSPLVVLWRHRGIKIYGRLFLNHASICYFYSTSSYTFSSFGFCLQSEKETYLHEFKACTIAFIWSIKLSFKGFWLCYMIMIMIRYLCLLSYWDIFLKYAYHLLGMQFWLIRLV